MKNKPKAIPGGVQSAKSEGAKDPPKKDEPKVVFSILIEALDNGSSRHKINMHPVMLEPIRDMLFRHQTLIEEQIIMIKIQQQQNKVKIVGPNQMPPGMKLHS